MSDLTFKTRDEYNRKPIAESITRLIESNLDITPLVIDGGWGTGKSEFCKKLIALVKEEDKFETVYIDAFQADHANEPLLSLIAALASIMPESEKKTFIQKAIPAIKSSTKIVLKAAVSHVLRQDMADAVEEFDKDISKASDKAIDSAVDRLIHCHVNAKENLEQLKSVLRKAAEKNPLIVFIDELDRCKPNYALETLELIKHTFDIKGIHFVLVTNLEQIKASVNHCYGQGVDAQRYLEKFIKFTVKLPLLTEISEPLKTHVSKKHFKKLTETNNFLTQSKELYSSFVALSERVIDCHNYSLREIETLVRYMEVYYQLSESQLNYRGQHGDALMTAFGVVAYALNPSLAESIYNGKATTNDLMEFFKVFHLSSPKNHINEKHEIITFIAKMELPADAPDAPSVGYQDKYKETVKHLFTHTALDDDEKKFSLVSRAIGVLKLTGQQ